MTPLKLGGTKKAKPILKKGRYQGKPSTAGPPSRGVTFESEDDRRNNLARWKEAQVVFRAEMEVLWREQEKLRKAQEFRVSTKMVTYFIIGFLMIIPFMSSYQDSKYDSSMFSNTIAVISKGVNGNQTIPQGTGSNGQGIENTNSQITSKNNNLNQDGTMMVSVSHVDYTILPTPKSVTLKIDPSIPQNDCEPSLGQELQVFQSNPLWALQLPNNPPTASQSQNIPGNNQHFPISITESSESSWTTITLVKQEASVDSANGLFPYYKNETIIAVALMIDEKSTHVERDSGRLRALTSSKTTTSFPLKFVGLPWALQGESDDESSIDKHVSYEIRLANKGACETTDKSIREWWYTAPLESTILPQLNTMAFQNFPAHTTQGTSESYIPIRHVFYFGGDSSFFEMARYDQSYRSQIDSMVYDKSNTMVVNVNANNATRADERLSPRMRAKKFLKSIKTLATRNRDEGNLGLFENGPLSLDTISLYMEKLASVHGQSLRRLSDEPSYLVVGSSFHDVRKYADEMASSTAASNSPGDRNKRRNLRSLNEIVPSKDSSLNLARGNDETKDPKYDHEHILACHELIERLQMAYPGVQVIWRLPLYVPFDDKKALWRVEKAMMEEWNIPTWDLYAPSYVAWVAKQMTPSSELEDLYQPGLFKEVALKALIPDEEDNE